MTFAALLWILLGQGEDRKPVEHPVLPQYYQAPVPGPALVEVSMAVIVRSNTKLGRGFVNLPAPGDYDGQAVVGLRVESQPTTAIKTWRLRKSSDGLNQWVVAYVESQGHDVRISYTARVLLPQFPVIRTQTKNFRLWSDASPAVPVYNPLIQAEAKKIRESASSRSEFVNAAVHWVAANKTGQVVPKGRSDALSALAYGGDSLGRADLCASLLRANGIPARVISYMPTWAEHMDAEFWLVEYASEDGTWEMCDPFVGIQSLPRNSAVVLSISKREDEGLGSGRALRPYAPAMSTPEISPELEWAPVSGRRLGATIELLKRFPAPSGARLMTAASRRSERVLGIAKHGIESWFDETSFQQAVAQGPTGFALFLDGRPLLPKREARRP